MLSPKTTTCEKVGAARFAPALLPSQAISRAQAAMTENPELSLNMEEATGSPPGAAVEVCVTRIGLHLLVRPFEDTRSRPGG